MDVWINHHFNQKKKAATASFIKYVGLHENMKSSGEKWIHPLNN